MSTGHDHQSNPYYFLISNPVPRELLMYGLCTFPEMWPDGLWDFSVEGESPKERNLRRTSAARVCQQCPVRVTCERYAADNHQSGVWGGQVFRPDLCGNGGMQDAPRHTAESARRSTGAPKTA